MSYSVSVSASALRELRKFDRPIRQRILDALDSVGQLDDPRARGKALTGTMGDYWRYRVGDYRVICEIYDDQVCIVAVRIGHRKSIYRSDIH